MRKYVLSIVLTLSLVVFAFGQDKRQLKGTVTDGKNPIENVSVQVEGLSQMALTDKKGKYQIEVATGDLISFSFTGLKTIRIKIEDVTRILNPVMIPDITELDEVELTLRKRLSQKDLAEDYPANKRIIKTAWGFLNTDRAAGRVQILTEDQINPANLCLLDLVRGKFPGVSVVGNCNGIGITGGAILIRGAHSINNSIAAIYDIDGQIFTDFPWWLDINNVKRVAIFGNLATTTLYGGLGASGVVVVNTVGANLKNEEFIDHARLRNNFYKNDALIREKVSNNWPVYKKDLYTSKDSEDAKTIYNKYSKTYSNAPYFILDAQSYFVKNGDSDFADKIISENFHLFDFNPVLLKALAYQYEAQGNYDMANQLYKDIFILRPNYGQSYIDIAKSYRDIGRAKQAATIFARYNYLVEVGFMELDTIGLMPMMNREFNNLLALERRAVMEMANSKKKLYLAKEEFKGTRLLFEWNDGEAEFDLQFVSPDKRYSLWKHSLADNAEQIAMEKNFGYNIKEELIDNSLPGTWQINVKYHGNKSLTPTYLKATVYYDYGQVSQRKEVKVFKLSLKDVNQELFPLTVGSKMVSR
ncbi:carboxypeptidase-like regulatory domain-containing protein [Croceitalea rosinachiae]|uniref:Carboxypeptidase-like regulatory domain-containing protein n=1 Tax=Croceitalea rosinachiae TaxID=3075596 RepID=A0ABU3AB05_9FLAO|nr:carboxypeptidase-like regulatory domain-containing protein [Croceitalea sp. F388]MDT0607371.1 carboxypeptidase-like regulatory domain-containing protein [Croceitalea sp. F388]